MMYKQMHRGFKRKTVPTSIAGGFLLLTISYYEAIWNTSYGMWISYLLPAIVLTTFSIIMFMLTFVSYEYRLLNNQIVFRQLIFGKPHHALVLELEKTTKITDKYCAGTAWHMRKQRYFLPLINMHRRTMISSHDEHGVMRHVLFKPSEMLVQMLRQQLECLGEEEAEHVQLERE